MPFRVRYTRRSRDDLLRLYGFLLEHDIEAARRARTAIIKGIDFLKSSPFSCRKADTDNPFLRELVVSFGSAGYVVLFEIEGQTTISILAVRHQRESDFH